ncbi:MAG: CheR family methyltransferase [Pseudanabaenaceae cyanobacterium SKYGB_i_bin29]|nr:tetratricopeptide repeat protein [Pseudanabaenaceae cyanobacterium SKYG29]MDW8422041.1 CheR family methyltransferase [Pseudanabaenaceae cyanobacterium SKYGB_i_bin29]
MAPNSPSWHTIVELIREKTGIRIRQEDQTNLQQKIRQRIKNLGLTDEKEYANLLRSNQAKAEWDQLATLITTGESYFLRDRGQINLLREKILPDLLQNKAQAKQLTILSAGCSTGEEVYSLAILLQEIPYQLQDWQINLVGVDINQQAIEKAKRGIYSEWSFRGVENHYRSLYFRRHLEGWEVVPSLKQGVQFYQCNLVEDELALFTRGNVDLIICRNVFIYFDVDKIQVVVQKFIDLLQPGGYLVTGHTELQAQAIAPLELINHAESLTYRMPTTKISHELTQSIPFVPVLPENHKQKGKQMVKDGNYLGAIEQLQEWLASHPQDSEALLLVATAYANQGQYQASQKICQQILAEDHACLEALHLLAQIAEEQSDREQAKEYLRRMIFIDPNYIPPYFDLIDLHLQDGEQSQAERLIQAIIPIAKTVTIEQQAKLIILQQITESKI